MYSRAVLTTLASNSLKVYPRFCRLASSATGIPSSPTSTEVWGKKADKAKIEKPKGETLILFSDKPAIQSGKANPFNTVLIFVPQEEAWVIERMGKFHKVLYAGHHFLLPFVDKIRYVQSLKEIIVEVPGLNVITRDGVSLKVVSVLHVSVTEPKNASYGTDDPEFAAMQLAQTVLSSEVSKIPAEQLISDKESISKEILEQLNQSTSAWGLSCIRFSIRELNFPPGVQESLHRQLITENQKEMSRLESEAAIATELRRYEHKRQNLLKYWEAKTNARYHYVKSEADAILMLADARAKELEISSKALSSEAHRQAATVRMAEDFLAAIAKSKLSPERNSTSDIQDVARTVKEALELFEKVSDNVIAASDEDAEYISDREGSRN